jgi:hypothetical protein
MHVVDDYTDVVSWQHGGETRERVDVGPAPRTIQRDHDRCRCQCNFIASTLWTPVTVRLYSIGDCFLLKASACLAVSCGIHLPVSASARSAHAQRLGTLLQLFATLRLLSWRFKPRSA